MQNSEFRMQNYHLARSLPAARGNENNLRFSQVILFTGAAYAAHELDILRSAF